MKNFKDAGKKAEGNKEVNQKMLSSTALDHFRKRFPVKRERNIVLVSGKAQAISAANLTTNLS